VGSSTRSGVGGASGLVDNGGASVSPDDVDAGNGATGLELGAGVKGSLVLLGKLEGSRSWPIVGNSTDLTKTTWQFSGCILL
jgi:hypothetical protein